MPQAEVSKKESVERLLDMYRDDLLYRLMNFDAIFNLLKDLHVEVLEEISQIFHMPDEIGDKIVDNSVKRVLGIFGIEPVY
jgi:hypothetical protein